MNQEGRHPEIAIGLTVRNWDLLCDWVLSRHCAPREDWCRAFVATRGFIDDQSPLIENMLKALSESFAYLVAPRNQIAVVELIMKKCGSKTH
jgi:hypothetical protein